MSLGAAILAEAQDAVLFYLLALTPKYTCFEAPFCRDLWFLEGNCRPHCPRKALEVLREAGILAPRGGACEMPPYLF